MWVLILVLLSSTGHTEAALIGQGVTMADCFQKREELLINVDRYDGYFPAGMQAVCIKLPIKGEEV